MSAVLGDDGAVHAALIALGARDARILALHDRIGGVELRTYPRGFEGLARIVCGQLLSVASARAIWARVEALGGASVSGFLNAGEGALRGAGLSGAKYATIANMAQEIAAGRMDLAAIERESLVRGGDWAIEQLCVLKGVGPWTAEIYVMFCMGHGDVFPCGDLALRKAVGEGLALGYVPSERELRQIVSQWAPYRSAAALLFWRYYAMLNRDKAWTTL